MTERLQHGSVVDDIAGPTYGRYSRDVNAASGELSRRAFAKQSLNISRRPVPHFKPNAHVIFAATSTVHDNFTRAMFEYYLT
jgi:hypothetical protein